MNAPNIAVLVSGSGTLLEAMIKEKVPISLVLADRKCRGLEIAEEASIDQVPADRKTYGYHQGVGNDWDREGFTDMVASLLRARGIDVVAMAGFMTIFSPSMFTAENFEGRVLNSHPALLPLFPGEHAVRDTLVAGAAETGSTIHIATEIMDDPRFIVAQQGGVPVLPDDTVDSLWDRIKRDVEWQLYPKVLRDVCSGAINLADYYQPG